MRLARPGTLVAALAMTAAVVSACGGGDGGGGATPTRPADTSASPTPAGAARTPRPSPVIEGNRITSRTKGYTALFPEGWNPHPNVVETVDGSTDTFFEPLTPGATSQPSIAITCITVRYETEEKRIQFEGTRIARLGNEDIQQSSRTIAGRPATVISYRFKSQTQNLPLLDVTEYFFDDERCDWNIKTSAPEGQRAAYQPTFDIFLNSLTLGGGIQ